MIQHYFTKIVTGKLFPNPRKTRKQRPKQTFFSFLTAFLQSLLTPFPHKHSSLPSLPLRRGLSLPPSTCVRGCPGVSVMTVSQCSSLPISSAVITQAHMELSITRSSTQELTHPAERARDSASGRQRVRERVSFQQLTLYHSKRPHTVPISSMMRVAFNYSNCAAIPQFARKC